MGTVVESHLQRAWAAGDKDLRQLGKLLYGLKLINSNPFEV